ncbi:MAG TPA: NifB/NifX family molybdenum-iron cluster-binding protein [candidate division Zixibacteria bacterium]|nr:NifB/NifX family molybdenum-iron cluster-binding protein [candidate division Zixibacteria bacterium]
MKIAIPTANGVLCPHFGHCQQFAIIDATVETKTIDNIEMHTPPPHEPGSFPKWLGEMGCDVIIAGGMGGRAVELFEQAGIEVVMGAASDKPEEIVLAFLADQLATGANPCDDPNFHDEAHGSDQCHEN